MSTPRQAFAAATAANVTPSTETDRLVRELASLVAAVATKLESPSAGNALPSAVAECNSALEGYLEMQRADRDQRKSPGDSGEELRRLGALLPVVEGEDVAFVLRQIRRVLGRLDKC